MVIPLIFVDFIYSVILSNIDESVIISLEKGHHESLIFYYDL